MDYDVVLVGGGIMTATLGMLLRKVAPDWSILVLERLDGLGLESSSAWNNAGTGHAGLCEFNYTPLDGAGSIDVGSAVTVGEQFHVSKHFWAKLVADGLLGEPEDFIRTVPHFGFAHGAAGVEHLRLRYEALRHHPLFEGMTMTQDRDLMSEWLPLMFDDRSPEDDVALCRSGGGTDVDYGVLTRRLCSALEGDGAEIRTGQEVRSLSRSRNGWDLQVRDLEGDRTYGVHGSFVFLGAGGATLPLLQRAGVDEVSHYGGFPISGQFLRTDAAHLVSQHRAKVYGHAEPGAPAISVPHLDTRIVDGREYLMFGPFAAFSPRFLKRGALLDLPRSVTARNWTTYAGAGIHNQEMVRYLIGQLAMTDKMRTRSLRRFVPTADSADWQLSTAGQRVQVVKRVGGRGTIAGFGTEIVTPRKGRMAALLGASPGASASASIMADVLARSFPDRMSGWSDALQELIPDFGVTSSERAVRMATAVSANDGVLKLSGTVAQRKYD
ncbi:malate dehydrogenase (quinone) [Rhodococcoides yunnanense]|uniref:malate dehydrogenase (quinone) n=1 Tax=Rhodococcoides yunnanense TaxID=278209 RepID=UPI0009343D6F|nr:malate dehydrogenase (quinone) [Rhodococcus yunnanensis]